MADPDYLRIGDTERTAMTESLHEHFVQGRLTREELDERLAATLTAKTVGDLRAIDRDLPKPLADRDPDPESWGGPPWSAHHRLAHRPGLPPVHHRHGPRPLRLLLATALLIAVVTATSGWAVVAVMRVFFIVWLVMAVAGCAHGRWRHRTHRPYR
jgi:DUF1707 SHOCT-like domain